MTPGARLGPYEITSSLGKGGMGEVWRARDPRLNREVAIKVSALQFTDRFEREAHAIAALNHPNICTLFDIGPNYLVMELIDGPTLAERIAEGAIPVDEALAIARQIADALEAAHDKGIVHRDLKPANIKIRPDGSVKVLDFGLAKSAAEATVSSDSPTMLSVAGMILGTAGYMAPEQARGKPVDKRADIWAFGVVVYEMVTAQRLFEGETVSDTLASVLTRDPDWTQAPHKVRRLLKRCLEKEPKNRLRDISGVELLLEEPVSAPAPSQSRSGWAGWLAAGAFAVAAAALALIHFRETPLQIPLTRLNITPPEKASFLGAGGTPPAVSSDGKQVVFEAATDGKTALWLRALDSPDAQRLPGTEGASYPFWSPDNKWIGFFSGEKLKKMPVSGGSPTVLADAPSPRGGTWSQSGVIVFAPTSVRLQQVSTSGGAVSPVAPEVNVHVQRFPWFLPDGRHFLFMRGSAGEGGSIRIGSLDSPTQDRDLLNAPDSMAIFAGTGQAQGNLLYVRGTTLVARPFDTKALAFTGEAAPVADQIQANRGTNGIASFSASANGVLLYESGLNNQRLTWFDRSGKRLSVMGDAGDFGIVEFSPDRKTAAVADREAASGNWDIWLYDVLRGLRTTRFTSDPAVDTAPVWSPDGRTIVFRSTRAGSPGDLYRKPADGSRNEELLYSDNMQKTPGGFSPDSKYLVYSTSGDPRTGSDVWILPGPLGTPGASKPYPFLRTEFNEQFPEFSPDGHWIAYQSNESGRTEVYVAPFPGPGGKQQISTSGGTSVRWRADGKALFYFAADYHLMAAEVSAGEGGLAVGKVESLFALLQNPGGHDYDVSADGQRFLAIVSPEGEIAAPLTVVQNWTAGLKK